MEPASEVAERLGVDRKPLFRAIRRHCVVSPGMSNWLKAMEWAVQNRGYSVTPCTICRETTVHSAPLLHLGCYGTACRHTQP